MEKRVIYLTVCVSSFPSQFVSSDEIAINLNRAPVPTVRHGQGDAPYLVSCTTYVSSASQNAGISRGLHRLNISYACSVAQTTRRPVPAHVFMKWCFYAGALRPSL